MEQLFATTSVRLTNAQRAKLDLLALSLNTSRNRVFGMLIESAEIRHRPTVAVGLQKNNGCDANALAGHNVAAVRA